MLICHCRAVNDGAIRNAIAAGARRPEDIARSCGAGSRCGGCVPALLELLAEHAPAGAPAPLEASAA